MGGKPRRKSYIDEAFDNALALVKLCEWRIMALEFAMRGLRDKRALYGRSAGDDDYNRLHMALYRELNDAYSRMMMWATVAPSQGRQKKAAKLAFKRYLKDGMEIMSHLNTSGLPPGMHQASEYDAFRAELDALAKEIGFNESD